MAMATSTITKTNNSKGEGTMTKKYQKKQHTPKGLRKHRINNGYTIYSLADRLGVSYSSVSYWETGEKFPRHDKILKLEEIFGVGYSELFRDLTEEEVKEVNARTTNQSKEDK